MLINRKLLLDTLAFVRSGLAAREILEQTCSFIFMDGRVVTYNDEVSVSMPLPLNIKGAVQSKEFYALLAKATGMDIDISVVDGQLVLTGNTGMIATMPINNEILVPIDEMPAANNDLWNPLDESFPERLKLCLQTVSKNAVKPALCAVHWKAGILESSDNYQITRCTLSTSLSDGVEVLLPSRSASELVRFGPVFCQIADGWIHFKSLDGVIFSCRFSTTPYPDLGAVIAFQFESSTPVKFSPRLPKILERSLILAARYSEGEPFVHVSIRDNQLTVKAGQGSSRFEEPCTVKCAGDFEFRINPEFLRKMLEVEAKANIAKSETGRSCLTLEGDGIIRVMVLSKPLPE